MAPYMNKFISSDRKDLGTGCTGCPPRLYGPAKVFSAKGRFGKNDKKSRPRHAEIYSVYPDLPLGQRGWCPYLSLISESMS